VLLQPLFGALHILSHFGASLLRSDQLGMDLVSVSGSPGHRRLLKLDAVKQDLDALRGDGRGLQIESKLVDLGEQCLQRIGRGMLGESAGR
jgi:hypothetical protein